MEIRSKKGASCRRLILATYVPDDRVVDEPTYSRVADILDPIERIGSRCGFLAGFKAVREDAVRHGQCVTDYPDVTLLFSLVQHDWSSRCRPCGKCSGYNPSRQRIRHSTASTPPPVLTTAKDQGLSEASQQPVPAQAKPTRPKPARSKDQSPCTKQTQASWNEKPECEWRKGVGCSQHYRSDQRIAQFVAKPRTSVPLGRMTVPTGDDWSVNGYTVTREAPLDRYGPASSARHAHIALAREQGLRGTNLDRIIPSGGSTHPVLVRHRKPRTDENCGVM